MGPITINLALTYRPARPNPMKLAPSGSSQQLTLTFLATFPMLFQLAGVRSFLLRNCPIFTIGF